MEIGLTEGLGRCARIKSLPPASESDLFFCWDANRVDIGNKKFLVIMNSANRLCAITLMSIFDWHRIDELIPQLIADAIAMAGMSDKGALRKAPNITSHARERLTEHGVSDESAMSALANPLHAFPISTDEHGRRAQKVIGHYATVVVNPDTGAIITAYRTGRKTRRRYGAD